MIIGNGKYKVLDKIGEGVFGVVYSGIYLRREECVAIKTESKRTMTPTLKHETMVLKYLQERGCDCIPIVHWFGTDENFAYLVMTYYECSLFEFLEMVKIKENFSLNRIFQGIIRALYEIHRWKVIHRDIKPHNFMLKSGELYIIDFGLATFYDEDTVLEDIKCSRNTIVGSPKYISYFVHDGCVPSFRDDLISVGYMYMYFWSGGLVWEDIYVNKNENKENNCEDKCSIFTVENQRRKELKSLDNIREQCSTISSPLLNYMNYCYSLKYGEKPNYENIVTNFA
jgi:serine/threonine protein kinase